MQRLYLARKSSRPCDSRSFSISRSTQPRVKVPFMHVCSRRFLLAFCDFLVSISSLLLNPLSSSNDQLSLNQHQILAFIALAPNLYVFFLPIQNLPYCHLSQSIHHDHRFLNLHHLLNYLPNYLPNYHQNYPQIQILLQSIVSIVVDYWSIQSYISVYQWTFGTHCFGTLPQIGCCCLHSHLGWFLPSVGQAISCFRCRRMNNREIQQHRGHRGRQIWRKDGSDVLELKLFVIIIHTLLSRDQSTYSQQVHIFIKVSRQYVLMA